MQRIKCAHSYDERLQCSCEYWRRQFDQRHPTDQRPNGTRMTAAKTVRVNTIPDLISRRRLEMSGCRQIDSDNTRSSARRWASATELSR
jgi:hypothetical protein